MQKERKQPNQPNVHFVDEMGQTGDGTNSGGQWSMYSKDCEE